MGSLRSSVPFKSGEVARPREQPPAPQPSVAAGGPGRSAENTGIQFPQSADGHRRTSETTKAIFAAALERVNPEMARALPQDRSWRQQYPRYLRELTERSLERPEVALATAQAGLATAWNAFEFWRHGQPHALDAAMAAPSTSGLRTATVEGKNLALPPRWEVPYRGQLLAGDALLRQIDVWERAGVMEPSHAEALRVVQRHPEWLDLSDRTFALLGAGAEAGPFSWLMRWRAHVAAVDLKRPPLWARLIEQARAGNGRLLAPVPPAAAATSAEEAGADLLTEAPEIAQWLLSLDRPLDIASLAYLDGARHTRVSMAMDAIATTVSRARPRTSLACMATPTDVFAVPEEIIRAAQSAYRERSLPKRVSQAGLRTVSRGRFFLPHEGRLIESSTGRRYGTVDCIVLEQGPSYALAKRLQQWRAVVAREAGQVVSINIAPSTTTHSVVKNPLLAAAYRGADLFGVESFAPETTNSIMAALWVHDLRNPTSPAQPSTALHHPLELLMLGANHGGMWRLPYLPRSVLPLSALVGFTRRPPRKGSA